MKGIALTLIVAVSLAFVSLSAEAQVDSSKLRELDKRLEEYFISLEPETVEVKDKESDLLVQSASDSCLRQHIALKFYDHYLNSPLMGDEAVAIHIFDAWFATGKIKMISEIDMINAGIFADFNRQSLIGMEAPPLEMDAPDGSSVEVGGPSSRYRVLFFYDTDCAKCKLETILLRNLLDDEDFPIDFYAIYTGSDSSSWQEWRESEFSLEAEDVKVIHLWDPDISSDFQKKYGVLQTPRMFLLDFDGIIVGRGLDADALQQLLDAALYGEDYEYGSDSSVALYDSLFSFYGDSLSAKDVVSTAELVESRTLGKGDTLGFKHLEGDLMYYLSSKRSDAWCEGTLQFMNKFILGRGGIWNTQNDSLQIVGLAEMMNALLSRTPVGSKIPKEPVDGWNKLRRRGGYIFFHSEGCPVCEKEMAVADSLKVRYLPVNMDALMESDQQMAQSLLDTFDLSALPFAVEVGRRGVVKRKYFSLTE